MVASITIHPSAPSPLPTQSATNERWKKNNHNKYTLTRSLEHSDSNGSCAFVRRAAAAAVVIYCALSIVNVVRVDSSELYIVYAYTKSTHSSASLRMNGG